MMLILSAIKYMAWFSKRGNAYFHQNGGKITDGALLKKLKSIYVPPAYKDVKVYPDSKKKIAEGYDKKGRLQTLYHSDFKKQQAEKKYCRIMKFNQQIPKMEVALNKRMRLAGFPLEKQVAVIVKIIMHCHFRIGSEENRERYNSFGITTIQKKHLNFHSKGVTIQFIGKKGVENMCILDDAQLVRALKHLHRHATARHIFHIDGAPIRARMVNLFIREFGDFSSKDFRTWYANKYLIEELRKITAEDTVTGRKKQLNTAVARVAERLHHTAAICKKSYIDRDLQELFLDGNFTNSVTLHRFLSGKC